jgi:hypothetical protein
MTAPVDFAGMAEAVEEAPSEKRPRDRFPVTHGYFEISL